MPKNLLIFFTYRLGTSDIKAFRRLKVYIIKSLNKRMKLQKRFLRKHKNKDYYKFMVNLPPLVVKEAGLKYGDDLEVETKDGKIILKKKGSDLKKIKG